MKTPVNRFSVAGRLGRVLGLLLGLLAAVGATTPAAAQSSTAYTGKLGVNLDGISARLVVDFAKTASPWENLSGSRLAANQLDANGWPTTDFRTVLMDLRPVPEWAGTIDDPAAYRVSVAGTHKGSFNGKAVITNGAGPWSVQNQSYDAATNTTTFDLVIGAPGPNHGLVLMQFASTQRTATAAVGSGITNLKVIRAGYPTNTSKFFTDDLVKALTGVNFSVVRAKDVTGTSNIDGVVYPATLDWAGRKLPTDALQVAGLGTKKEAVAWEHFIDLCNQVNKDIWVNIPVSATPNYVTQLATLLKTRLNPNLKVYVENDNEIWNGGGGGFTATYNYNRDQATALGFTGYGFDKKNHARRTHELAQLFEGVFGAGSLNQRVRVVLCWHQPLRKWDVTNEMLPYLNTMFGAPRNYLYAIGTQTYFGPANPPANATAAQLVSLLKAGIDGQVDEPSSTGNEAGRKQWIAAAQQWQLPGGLVSYEGGPGTAYGEGNTANIGNAIQMHREAGMKDAVKYNLKDAWWDLGAGLAMQFTLSSGYQRYGQYGLTDDLSNPDRNAKYQAMRELVGSGTGTPPSGGTFSGAYTLTARHSGKRLNVNGASSATGASVIQWTASPGAANEQWTIKDVGNGYYSLTAVHSGKCLDVNGAGTANGTKVQQWDANTTPAQRWKIEPTTDGYYRLTAECSGKVLDVSGVSTADGALVHQWEWLGQANQQWKIEPAATATRPAAAPPAPAADEDKAFSAYPNPSPGGRTTLHLTAQATQSATVHVRDRHGQLVGLFSVPLKAGQTDFRLPATLPAGTYFLETKLDQKPQRFTLKVE